MMKCALTKIQGGINMQTMMVEEALLCKILAEHMHGKQIPVAIDTVRGLMRFEKQINGMYKVSWRK